MNDDAELRRGLLVIIYESITTNPSALSQTEDAANLASLLRI